MMEEIKSYNELYSYLKNMPDREYVDYLDAIKDFVKSDKIYPLGAEYFAEILSSNKILEKIYL